MSSKFFIPDIGFRFKLVNDVTLKLMNEDRNRAVLYADPYRKNLLDEYRRDPNFPEYYQWEQLRIDTKFLAGTILSVDRVYIRKGASDFSSVSFNILESPLKIFQLKSRGGKWDSTSKRRFFIPLEDVNNLEFEPV